MTAAHELEYLSHRVNIDCVCGDSGGLTVRRTDRYGLKFRYKLCVKCGHVRTYDPLSSDSAHRFYSSSDYRSMYFPNESAESVLLRKTPKPNTISPLLNYVQKLQIPCGNLVEWGCGGGWNLVPFRDAGWNVQGFDYDRPYVELGRELLGLPLQEITSEEIKLQTTPPDIILLNHVLEHAVEPSTLLKRLKTLCSETTTLVVGVPLLETIPVWHWRDFFHVAHIHYFSAESLARVASLAGFQVVHRDIQSGMFALVKSDDVVPLSISTGSPMKSALFLAKGFIEPRYRARQIVRGALTALGLISIARRAKNRVVR